MYNKKTSKKSRIEAVVIALLFIGTALLVPSSTFATNAYTIPTTNHGSQKNFYSPDSNEPFVLDRSYYLLDPDPASTNVADNDDAGYKKDAGRDLNRATPLYPGELLDDTPGRGVSGKISSTDTDDWYYFSVCQGQQFTFAVTPPAGFDVDLSLWTVDSVMVTSSNNSGSSIETMTYTATYTGKWYVWIKYVSGTGTGQYTFTVTMINQNDANSGSDAPNVRTSALLLTPGTYFGYLDMNDPYDWYKVQATTGQGIHVILKMKDIMYLTDFDLQLYNPSGLLVYEGNQYYDDEFNYPADATGEWSIRVDIFPGWVDCPQPTEWKYYSYGAGPYNLTVAIETSGDIPDPISQPQITPIAKTVTVTNDPDSTKDDFGYLAAIPACNYLDAGKRYLAPIIYTGDSTPTAYYDDPTEFGTVNDMTQYLVDDWGDYLGIFGKTPDQYTLPTDPVQAAAELATQGWTSSQTAVVAVDGSSFEDTTKTVVKRTKTLARTVKVDEIQNDDPKLSGNFGYMMFVGPKWGAISVNTTDISVASTSAAGAVLTQAFPKFMDVATDDWPVPYDGTGDAGDIYFPVTRMGFWAVLSGLGNTSYDLIRITKHAGDRYRFRVTSNDAVINALLSTDQPSDLLVFLVDPQGNLRSPIPAAWNGPVNPIHVWNGLENPASNPWRCWNPAPHTEFTAEVLHPEKGLWTAIVVPRNAEGADVKYTLQVDVRTVNQDRADAEISAANAAVIASLNHLPLLYVTPDSVPTATASAFSALGVTNVIFVERGEIGADVRSKLPTVTKDLKTMQEIIDEIKSYPASENYITATSLKTGDGYFAPAAMLAAYHGAPVIRVEDAPDGDPAAVAERIQSWQRWDGDYYHGSRANGHLPHHNAPVEQNRLQLLIMFIKYLLNGNASLLPPLGLDAKRYWNEEMFTYFHNYIDSLGLDREGQEGYALVAPRTDINMEFHSVLNGNNSYAGHIPGITPAYSSNIVIRSVLYPALIFANPGRNVTTSSLMNYPEKNSWRLNDGKTYYAYSSGAVKNTFSSHLRTYDGHTFWKPHLERMNDGASVYYYSGHGTGGSGMSEMYEQTEHSNYPEQVWWDAWRGYMYDNWKMPREVISGNIWFNPEPPNLYDIIHYKWVDQLFQNLRSNAVFYMSCTTGDGDGPLVFLEHGAVIWYGNANTGLCPEADIGDDEVFKLTLVYGESVGVAWSKQVWLHYRDFTTSDNTSMYGPSSMYPINSIQVIYGDPSLVIYSPEWDAPIPIDA